MNGQGCNCAAKSEVDCDCGVDWTSKEVYELRRELKATEEASARHCKDAVRLAGEVEEQEARCLGLGKDKELLKLKVCRLEVENMALRSALKLGVKALKNVLLMEPEHCDCGYEGCNEPKDSWDEVRSALAKIKESLQ